MEISNIQNYNFQPKFGAIKGAIPKELPRTMQNLLTCSSLVGKIPFYTTKIKGIDILVIGTKKHSHAEKKLMQYMEAPKYSPESITAKEAAKIWHG